MAPSFRTWAKLITAIVFAMFIATSFYGSSSVSLSNEDHSNPPSEWKKGSAEKTLSEKASAKVSSLIGKSGLTSSKHDRNSPSFRNRPQPDALGTSPPRGRQRGTSFRGRERVTPVPIPTPVPPPTPAPPDVVFRELDPCELLGVDTGAHVGEEVFDTERPKETIPPVAEENPDALQQAVAQRERDHHNARPIKVTLSTLLGKIDPSNTSATLEPQGGCRVQEVADPDIEGLCKMSQLKGGDLSDPYSNIDDCPLTRRLSCDHHIQGRLQDRTLGKHRGPEQDNHPEVMEPRHDAKRKKALVLYSMHGVEEDSKLAEMSNFAFFWQFGVLPQGRTTKLYEGVDYVFYRRHPDATRIVSCFQHGNLHFLWIPKWLKMKAHIAVLDFLGVVAVNEESSPVNASTYSTVMMTSSVVRGPFINRHSDYWVDLIGHGGNSHPSNSIWGLGMTATTKELHVRGKFDETGNVHSYYARYHHLDTDFLSLPMTVLTDVVARDWGPRMKLVLASEETAAEADTDLSTRFDILLPKVFTGAEKRVMMDSLLKQDHGQEKRKEILEHQSSQVSHTPTSPSAIFLSFFNASVTSQAQLDLFGQVNGLDLAKAIPTIDQYSDPCKMIFLRFEQGPTSLHRKTYIAVNRLSMFTQTRSGRKKPPSRNIDRVPSLDELSELSEAICPWFRGDPKIFEATPLPTSPAPTVLGNGRTDI